MKVWAVLNNGEAISATAVCDKHKVEEMTDLVDCSDQQLECQICGSRSTAYVLRTAKLIVNDATAEIADLNNLVGGNHALRVIAMMNCNLAQMIFSLARCVEQLATDQL